MSKSKQDWEKSFDQKDWDEITINNSCKCTVDGDWYCDDHFNYLGVNSKLGELEVEVERHKKLN